jgi:signal transduction histidine kinase/CheY-like chemotaxis protein
MDTDSSTAESLRPAARRRPWPLAVYFVALVVVAVAAAAAAAAFLSVQADRDAHRAAEHAAGYSASIAARRLSLSLTDARAALRGVAASLNGQVMPDSYTTACSLAFGGSDALPTGHIDIVRPNGAVICSSTGKPGRGYRGAAWLRRALRGQLFLAPVRDAATGKLSLLESAAVGRQAVVVTFVPLAPIAPSLARLYGGGRPSEFLLTSADGRHVLSRSIAPARWAGTPLAPEHTVPAGGADRRDVDGTKRIYVQSTVGSTGWRFDVGEDEGRALATGTSLRNRELWILGAGVAAVLLLALFIYRRVAVPIRRLAAAVRESRPTEGAVPVPVGGPAEVSMLAGDVNGLIAAVDDELQRRRELEEQLRHAQKMDALGRVVAGVAHDFNNLLTVIAGFTRLIVSSTRGDEAVRHHAEEAVRASERARMLIRQLLVFSRKEAATPALLDLNELVADMERLLARVIGANVQLRTQLSASPVVVQADRGQLEQVLMNLSVNARDAMPDGGSLVLATDAPQVDGESWAALVVADEGVGMDEETRERLFEPFFTTKPPGKGTGLGLATCYGIVSQLGGRIEVETEPGRGSVFRVLVPRVDAELEAPSLPAAAPARDGGGETVLVVEDDDGLRTLARLVLENAGYDVLDAPAAERGLEIASSHEGRIDLLLTDGVMAAMSGRELAQRFSGLHPEGVVIHMSGYEQESLPVDEAVPASAFLAKPFTPDGLLAALREALDRRQATR